MFDASCVASRGVIVTNIISVIGKFGILRISKQHQYMCENHASERVSELENFVELVTRQREEPAERRGSSLL